MSINYFSEEVDFKLKNQKAIANWLRGLILKQGFTLSELNYIFCSDLYLLKVNQEHLNHDFFTDIITFDNSDSNYTIESDIFISVDRVKENAQSLNQAFEDELHRVIVHGLLHLFGQKDKTEDEEKQMREKEDLCLSLLKIKGST